MTYAGCIGNDEWGVTMEAAVKTEGLTTLYQKGEAATGTCAVLVKDGERSLIANLSAAEKYTIAHTETAPVQAAIKAAGIYYIAGFVLTHSADSIMHVANHACDNDKIMCMNAAAPFLFMVPTPTLIKPEARIPKCRYRARPSPYHEKGMMGSTCSTCMLLVSGL